MSDFFDRLDVQLVIAGACLRSATDTYSYVHGSSHRTDYILRQTAYRAMMGRQGELNRLRYLNIHPRTRAFLPLSVS